MKFNESFPRSLDNGAGWRVVSAVTEPSSPGGYSRLGTVSFSARAPHTLRDLTHYACVLQPCIGDHAWPESTHTISRSARLASGRRRWLIYMSHQKKILPSISARLASSHTSQVSMVAPSLKTSHRYFIRFQVPKWWKENDGNLPLVLKMLNKS